MHKCKALEATPGVGKPFPFREGPEKLAGKQTMTALREYPLRNTARPREAEGGRSSEASVLTTWKEVARYMGKGVRTVQRWERDFGLPIRRPPGVRNRRAVLVLTADLDVWIALQCARGRRNMTAEDEEQPCATLHDRMQTAVALRIANRLLLNEIHIAMEALQQKLNSMCPPSAPDGFESREGTQ